MTAQLTGVTSAEVVTLRMQNINGDGQPHGDVPFGFLTADIERQSQSGPARQAKDQHGQKPVQSRPLTSATIST